ncbi:YcfL family protein [Vibrio sp.]|uniref:YcfL family protein n=1 Tax=Vibrio sp. TaxID=678 RepID=UPI003D10EBAB
MKKWLIAAMAAMVLVGCGKNTAGLRVDGATQSVLFGDRVLGSRLKVDKVTTSHSDDRARGIVMLTSQYTGDLDIEYRFYWYNSQGLEVNTRQGPWRRMIISGKDSATLSEVSVNPDGTQFRVQIRESQSQ